MSLVLLPRQMVVTINGVPRVGAQMFVYQPGTTTLRGVYTTAARTQSLTNPVLSQSNGFFPAVYVDEAEGPYKIVVKDSADVTIYTDDDIPASGRLVFDRTAAEIAAGITPTDTQYYPRDGVNVKRFGVSDANSASVNSTRLQNALDSGECLYIPRTSTQYAIDAELVPALSGQLIYGDGYLSCIRQMAANLNVFAAESLSHLRFHDFRLYAAGTRSDSYDGGGLYLKLCNEATISGLYVQGHRGNGVMFHNCNDALAFGNRFANSTVAENELHSQTGADILCYGSALRNMFLQNRCLSGNGYGIGIIKEFGADICGDNLIAHNLVANCIGYGIFIYNTGLLGNFYRSSLIGNHITNITGSQRDATDLQKYWGAGIYVVGAEKTIIDGGSIINVCQQTNQDTLAPGAIGITNASIVSIDNVDIDTSAYYGITVRDPASNGVAGGWATIGKNVTIRGTTKDAVQVVERGNVRCYASVEDSGAQGFAIANTAPAKEGFEIDMQINDCTGAGISTDYANDIRVRGRIIGSVVQNAVFQHGDDIDVAVVSKDSADTGIDFASTVTNARLHDSEVTGNLLGVSAAAPVRFDNNSVHDNTTNYGGTFALLRTLDNTGTPSVKYGKRFVTGGTATITNFTDGEPGQELFIRCAHSLAFDVTGTTLIGGTTNLAAASGDFLHWSTDDGTNWYLVGFMKNASDHSAGA